VIGHLKTDGHLGRCYFKGRAGDAANALLTAVGHNLRLVLAWLRLLLRLFLSALLPAFPNSPALKVASQRATDYADSDSPKIPDGVRWNCAILTT
jgi:IS5 family transposase